MAQIIVFLLAFALSWTSFVSGMENNVPEIVISDEFFSINNEIWNELGTEFNQQNAQQETMPLPIGFNNNSGTDCFMNASLQCLLNLPEFQSTVENLQPQGIFTNLTNNLIHLIKTRKGCYSSTNLGTFAIDARHHIFQRYNNQEDAGEFVIGLINRILLSVEKTEAQTIIESLLTNTLSSTRTCTNCNHISGNSEPTESVFKLEIPQHNVTLHNCLAQFFAPEPLTGKEQALCEECQSKQDSIKTFTILQPAQHIIMQAKAFTFNHENNESLKNATKIPFPLTEFSLNQYRHQDLISDCTYKLQSFVMHRGTLNGGHYIAFIKHVDGNWYLCNDDEISWVPEERIKAIATEGYYKDLSSSENFTPFIWFFSKQDLNAVEQFQERLETNNNQPSIYSSQDLIEVNEKFNLVKNNMGLLNYIINFREFFDLACKGLYHFALEKNMLPENIELLFKTNNIPLPSDYVALDNHAPQVEQPIHSTTPLEKRLITIIENQSIIPEPNEPLFEREAILNTDTPQPLLQRIHEQEILINDTYEIANLGAYESKQSDDQVNEIGHFESDESENQITELIDKEIAVTADEEEEDAHSDSTIETYDHSSIITSTQKRNTRTSQKANASKEKRIETTWQCEWHGCTYKNAEHKAFIDHVNSHKKEDHVCRWKGCNNKKFPTKQQVERHMLTHSKEKKYHCETCNVWFQRQAGLDAHKKKPIHKKNSAPQTQFACMWQNCNHEQKADLKSAQQLYTHVVEAHAQPNIKTCRFGECNKKFSRPIELLNHLRSETKYKEFICSKCGQDFITKYNKDKHEQKHSEPKKSFPCTMANCTRKFSRETDLKRHKKNIHRLNIPDGQKIKKKK